MTTELGGLTVEEAGIRLAMALGGCRHENPLPVTSVTGAVVAALCLDCDAQLPPGFGCQDCEYVEIHAFGQVHPERVLSEPCRAHSD